jgi:nitric oxide reductase NorQ protein
MNNFNALEINGKITTLKPKPKKNFVCTSSVDAITKRALAYLEAGYSIHFRGPAGTGKTTMALHVAATLGRPTMMITGDEDMATSTLIGMQHGYHYRKVVDRYIHTVTKTEETSDNCWTDNRLTTACREGYTIIYDEFTRSRPEANNILLGILEEGILVLPAQNRDESYIKVHHDFRIIFTSNPQEYAGVHDAQDALGDRIVTIDMDHPDRELEIAIVKVKSGLAVEAVTPIVDLIRAFRDTGEYGQTPTMRSTIMICRMMAQEHLRPTVDDGVFIQYCMDILGAKTTPSSKTSNNRDQRFRILLSLIENYCPSSVVTKNSQT